MISIDRILCPANLPLEFDEALNHAASLARIYDAKLFVCHCAATPALVGLPKTINAQGRVSKELADSLERYIGAHDSSRIRWDVVIVEKGTDVGEEIVNTARAQSVDLIVMRSRRSRMPTLLGSNAEQVSRTAACPVLVTHPQNHARGSQSNGRAKFERVLVCHDFSSSSELALSYALSIAQKYRAELHLMHVLHEPSQDEPEIASGESNFESAYERTAQRLLHCVPEEVSRQCRVVRVVRRGKPYREVLAYAREQGADLVCMGALGRDFGLEALFGSNVDRVLRQASCPVLIARPLGPATAQSVILQQQSYVSKTSSWPQAVREARDSQGKTQA